MPQLNRIVGPHNNLYAEGRNRYPRKDLGGPVIGDNNRKTLLRNDCDDETAEEDESALTATAAGTNGEKKERKIPIVDNNMHDTIHA